MILDLIFPYNCKMNCFWSDLMFMILNHCVHVKCTFNLYVSFLCTFVWLCVCMYFSSCFVGFNKKNFFTISGTCLQYLIYHIVYIVCKIYSSVDHLSQSYTVTAAKGRSEDTSLNPPSVGTE